MASESPLVPTGAISQADMEAARAAAIEVMKVANKKAEEPLVNPHKKTFTEAIDSLQTDSIERIQFLLVFGGLLGFISGAHTGKLECDAIYGDQLKAVQTAADKRRLLRDYFYEVRRNGTANGTKYSIKYAIYIGGYSVTEIISRKIWQDRESMVSHLVAGSVLGSSIGLTGSRKKTTTTTKGCVCDQRII